MDARDRVVGFESNPQAHIAMLELMLNSANERASTWERIADAERNHRMLLQRQLEEVISEYERERA